MWPFRKPSAERISAFLAVQREQPFSYAEVGCSRGDPPAGYNVDRNRILLGKGAAVFEAACHALRHWHMFPHGWMEVHPANIPVAPGNTAVVLAKVFGKWWMNACRVVYLIDESEAIRRFGFAYGTLPGHLERGEERFTIEWAADDTVWYDLLAISRPRHPLAWLGYPFSRRVQRRFAADSQRALKQAIEDTCARIHDKHTVTL